ncbi:MAG: ABC transporter permease [Terracidiphilus sp.]|jgi:putative ABC transport system permease protein
MMLIDRQDVFYAIRSARRTPLLTCVVVLALSVGIGLNAGVFTILNSMFLDAPTKKDPASFVQIYPRYQGWYIGRPQDSSFNAEDYDAIRKQSHSLADVAAWQRIGTTLDDVHRPGDSTLVTCNYFRVFGIDRPLMGRFFNADECTPGTPVRIVVLSEHFWRDNYSSDPHIVGTVIHISRQALTVIGIASDSSANLLAGDIWIPYALQPAFSHGNNAFQSPNWAWLTLTGRMRQGYSRADARAELETIIRQRDRFYLEQRIFTLDRRTYLVLTDGSFIHNPALQSVAMILMALIMGPLALVLLLACTNVTMLFLSRSVVRRGEIAIRLALGAGRRRLMRMLAFESFITAAAAGVVSIYLAARFPSLLFGFADPSHANDAASIRPDWRVFGFLAVLVLIATAASALAPMRESFRFDLITALKGREGAATMRSRTTSVLIVVQLAMSFVLLAAAVLFARLPFMITRLDPGFETRQVMTVPFDLEAPQYTENSARVFISSLEARILEIPGVRSLAWESVAPFNVAPISEVRLDNQTKGQGRPASIDNVTADFFATFGISLMHGRSFRGADVSATGSAEVAIVSQAFAMTFWGNNDAVGKVVVTPDDRRLVVIGVARDTRSERFSILDGPKLYTLQNPQARDGQLFVRFSGSAAPVSASIEEIINSLDKSQEGTPSTIWDFLETNATSIRSLAKIILFMAGIAVVLAITGVYGVLTFAISQRTREFGIQMMLGATRQSIFRSVMTKGIRQIALGLLFGLALAMPAAWAFMRIMKNGWLRIDTFDPSVYGISALILLVVSLLAMFLPAFRATRVDPIQALRNE